MGYFDISHNYMNKLVIAINVVNLFYYEENTFQLIFSEEILVNTPIFFAHLTNS